MYSGIGKIDNIEGFLKWPVRYMRIAYEVANWTSCLSRGVGCVITVDRRLVATGYNGAPSGIPSCKELGYCMRKGSPSGENLEQCLATHAEQNALLQAAKFGISVKNGDLYVTTFPCSTCMKMIINAGIKRIFYCESYNSPLSVELAKHANIELINIPKEFL